MHVHVCCTLTCSTVWLYWLNKRRILHLDDLLTCWHSVWWSTSRWYPPPHPRRRSPSSSWLCHTRPTCVRKGGSREKAGEERQRRGGGRRRKGEEKERGGEKWSKGLVPTMFPIELQITSLLLHPPIARAVVKVYAKVETSGFSRIRMGG